MARRRFQRGCLRKEGDRWALRYREDVMQADGTIERLMRNRTVGFVADLPTQRSARRAADLFLETINSAAYRPGVVVSFADFAKRWEVTQMPAMKPASQRVAKSQISLYLLPAFGRLTLQQITPEIVQSLVARQAPRLKRHTINNILSTLSGMLKVARRWGYHAADWRVDMLSLPVDKAPPRRPHFTPTQVHEILRASVEPWRTLFTVFAVTGMRGAEVLALSLDDVDFQGARIFVRRSTQSGLMQLPKSARSVRTIPMPPALADVLREHVAHRYKENPNRLLFCSGEGNPLWLDHVRERRLWPLLDALGIPRCGFHAFRHTAGSTFASVGASVKVAQEHLGHTDPRITLGIYQHVVDADHRHAACEVARVLLPEGYAEKAKPLIH